MNFHFVGIDWANAKHQVAIVDPKGAVVESFKFENNSSGFKLLADAIAAVAVGSEVRIGIEKHHGPVFHFLRSLPHTLYEIPPNRVAARRTGTGVAQSKSDAKDAAIIANLIRTDFTEMRSVSEDLPITDIVGHFADERSLLVKELHASQMRLTELLRNYFPSMIEVWSDITTTSALKFVHKYPTAKCARSLDAATIRADFKEIKYHVKRDIDDIVKTLRSSVAGCADEILDAARPTVRRHVERMLVTVAQISAVDKDLGSHVKQHPDASIFLSMPCVQPTLAAAFLTGFGTVRERFRRDDDVSGYAGIVPVTFASGKRRDVVARVACNNKFKLALIRHAFVTLSRITWARSIYDAARGRGKKHYHALRILARAWMRVMFQCWKNRAVYDPLKHRGAASPAPKAA